MSAHVLLNLLNHKALQFAADDNFKFCSFFKNNTKTWYFMRIVCWQTILMKYHTFMRIVCWQMILMKYHTLFCSKIKKEVKKLSSVAVVIGALRVKIIGKKEPCILWSFFATSWINLSIIHEHELTMKITIKWYFWHENVIILSFCRLKIEKLPILDQI